MHLTGMDIHDMNKSFFALLINYINQIFTLNLIY